MDGLTLIRPVLVKVQVTEGYKKAAAAELQEAVRRLEAELAHLDFQEKRVAAELEKKNPAGIPQVRQQFEQERKRRAESRQKALGQMKEIGQMPLGGEIVYARMESPVEIRVGDDWQKVLGVEVILKDGVVVSIRQGESPGDAGSV
ncbi:MAG: YlqD family protein [Eubacteriales bacterium]